jgi:predicted ATP-binding protein involved in virulence
MTANTLLRVDRLRLRNFRSFAECTIELHQQLTVLVAENGRGKTAVLDALGIALGPFVDTVAGTGQVRGFDSADVRLVRGEKGTMEPALPTEFAADGYVAGQAIHWSRALRSSGLRARTTNKEAASLRQAAKQLQASEEGSPTEKDVRLPNLPFVAFYGTGRLWSEHYLTEGKRRYLMDTYGRMSGYTDCLSSSSSFKGMVAWYENKSNETRDPRYKDELPLNLPLLAAVKEATRVALAPTGWCDLDWDFEKKSLVVGHPDYGRLPLAALSDGVRNMIALIADIARRCASLNPHLGGEAARQTPGVLLIDEVDMHLHPRWQQLVIGLLQEAFPAMQMILSTHSPHVLSTVDAESIRVIRLSNGQGVPEIPAFQTRGVESADILAKVMDVDPVPQVEQARWLSDYRALVQTAAHESTAAQSLWAKLVAHFGAEHPVLAEVETLRRLQEFKRANKLPLEGGS